MQQVNDAIVVSFGLAIPAASPAATSVPDAVAAELRPPEDPKIFG